MNPSSNANSMWIDDERSYNFHPARSMTCPTINQDLGKILKQLHVELENKKFDTFENETGHLYDWELNPNFKFPEDYCQTISRCSSVDSVVFEKEGCCEDDTCFSSDTDVESDTSPICSKFAYT